MRRAARAATGRRVVRGWRARVSLGASSLDRIALAFDDRTCLEVYSTARDERGVRVGTPELLEGDFRHPPPGAIHSGLVSEPPALALEPARLAGQTVAHCRLNQDERGDVLELWLAGGQAVSLRSETKAGRAALVLRLRALHDWE